MIKRNEWLRKASATIEFVSLVAFFLAAILVFQKYILQAFWGGWKKAGDTFGQGRQYDPRPFGGDGSGGGTLDCMYVYDDPGNAMSSGEWVLQPCFDDCMESPANKTADCRINCGTTSQSEAGYCYY